MGKTYGTQHHCPGLDGWVGDISPGGCRPKKVGHMLYCTKHQVPCINGCPNQAHLKNETGCLSCEQREDSEARRVKKKAEQDRKKAKKSADDDFFNPPKGRKKEYLPA